MKYSYRNSTEVIFTKNVTEEIINYANQFSVKKIFVVSGGQATSAIAQIVIEELCILFSVDYFTGVSTNPTDSTVYEATRKAAKFSPDMIITIGGGSVHDCGKAVSVLLRNTLSTNIDDYTVTGKLSVPGISKVIPLITIPTIFGSGAEVSPAALIRIDNQKKVIFSPLLHPKATLINVSFCQSLPVKILSRSAFDSFIQGLEGYISSLSNPISNAFAVSVMTSFVECYNSLLDGNIQDDDLERLAVASIFSSYVCSVASVGAIHALSDPISGRYDVHHADALAIVAPKVLKYNLSATKADLENINSILAPICSMNSMDVKENIINKVELIIESLNLGSRHYEVNEKAINEMVAECFNPDMVGNPHSFSNDEVKSILSECLL